MKRKSTKSALLMSFTSLLLCFAMLIGSTFAWFTDSVTSGVNRIVAGNLDVEVTHTNATVTEAATIKGEDTMFPDKDGKAMLWEPGAMSYENFTVKNVGTLALKYNMAMNVVDFNAVTGTNDNLKDALKVKVLTGNEILTAPTRESVANLSWTDAQTLEQFKKDGGKLYPATQKNATHPDEEKFQIIVYWQPGENDNRWNLQNGKTSTDGQPLFINFGVTVVATQLEHEYDSFDNLYDKTAEAPSIVMPTWSGESEEKPLDETDGATLEVKVNNAIRATATVEAGTKINGESLEENETLKLTIEPDDAPNGITVDTGNSVTTYDVSLVKVVTSTETGSEGTKTDVKVTEADTPVLVSLDIGIVDLVDFYHHGEKLTKVEATKDTVDTAITAEGYYWYDVANGTVYFKTKSFSPFASVYKFAGGLGTEEHPYLLSNAEQFEAFIKYKDWEGYPGYYQVYRTDADGNKDYIYFELTNDIDCSSVNWPTGYSNAYYLVFDGNNHKISNIHNPEGSLFNYVYYWMDIENVTFENCSMYCFVKYPYYGYYHDNGGYTDFYCKNLKFNDCTFYDAMFDYAYDCIITMEDCVLDGCVNAVGNALISYGGYSSYGLSTGFDFKNVDIKNSTSYGGAYIFYGGSGNYPLTFKDCDVVNTTVLGGEGMALGGFVGNASTSLVSFDTCSFDGTIESRGGLAAGFIGQACSTPSKLTIDNCSISENTLIVNKGGKYVAPFAGNITKDFSTNIFKGTLSSTGNESDITLNGFSKDQLRFNKYSEKVSASDFTVDLATGEVKYVGDSTDFTEVILTQTIYSFDNLKADLGGYPWRIQSITKTSDSTIAKDEVLGNLIIVKDYRQIVDEAHKDSVSASTTDRTVLEGMDVLDENHSLYYKDGSLVLDTISNGETVFALAGTQSSNPPEKGKVSVLAMVYEGDTLVGSVTVANYQFDLTNSN